MVWRLEQIDNQEKFSRVYIVPELRAYQLSQLRIFFIVFLSGIRRKASVWNWHGETSWLKTYGVLEPRTPGSEKLSPLPTTFTYLFFSDLVGRLMPFLGNKRNKRLLVGRSQETHRKASDVSAVTGSWLSQGCPVAGFSFLLCGHVFPIRQGCVTPGVGRFPS